MDKVEKIYPDLGTANDQLGIAFAGRSWCFWAGSLSDEKSRQVQNCTWCFWDNPYIYIYNPYITIYTPYITACLGFFWYFLRCGWENVGKVWNFPSTASTV